MYFVFTKVHVSITVSPSIIGFKGVISLKCCSTGNCLLNLNLQLFSSGLSQNGKTEKHGILGFLPADIMKEVKRGAKLVSCLPLFCFVNCCMYSFSH